MHESISFIEYPKDLRTLFNNYNYSRKRTEEESVTINNIFDSNSKRDSHFSELKLKENKILKNSRNIIKKKSKSKKQSITYSLMPNNSSLKLALSNRKSLSKKKLDLENDKKNDKKTDEKPKFLDEFIKSFTKEDVYNLFCDEELNLMEYKYATEIDKRDFITYYFSLIRQKQILIFSFLDVNDYNLSLMKILLFLCSFVLYFMTNTFFFDDENMHKIYIDNGKYNLLFQIPQILYSSIISSIITIILRNLSLTQISILKIKQIKEINLISKKFFDFFNFISI